MHLSTLEKAIVARFLADREFKPDLLGVDVDGLEVIRREFTGVGFMTELRKCDALKLFGNSVSLRWGRVGARIGRPSVDTGYLLYVEDGYLAAIEGYTYGGDPWPADTDHVELYELTA